MSLPHAQGAKPAGYLFSCNSAVNPERELIPKEWAPKRADTDLVQKPHHLKEGLILK